MTTAQGQLSPNYPSATAGTHTASRRPIPDMRVRAIYRGVGTDAADASDTLSDKLHGFWRLVVVDEGSVPPHLANCKLVNYNGIEPKAGKGTVPHG